MFGSVDTTPYDIPALFGFGAMALLLLAGLVSGQYWPPAVATLVRRALPLVAVALTATLLVVTPTQNSIAGAGRLITLWPALGLNLLFGALWSWRAGQW